MIVVFGGLATRGANSDVFTNDVHVWALRGASRWVALRTIEGRAPMPRCYHCATAVGSKLLIFGGNNADESFSDLAYLECTPTVSAPDTWSWHWPRVTGHGPRARTGATATAIGDRFVLYVGGWDPHEDLGGRASHRPSARAAPARSNGGKRNMAFDVPSGVVGGSFAGTGAAGTATAAARLAAHVSANIRTGEDEPEPFPEAWLLDTTTWTWLRIAGDVSDSSSDGAPSAADVTALKCAAGRVGHAATLLPDARSLLQRAAASGDVRAARTYDKARGAVAALLVHGGVKAGGEKHGDAALLLLPHELIDCGGRATRQLVDSLARSPPPVGAASSHVRDADDIPAGQDETLGK